MAFLPPGLMYTVYHGKELWCPQKCTSSKVKNRDRISKNVNLFYEETFFFTFEILSSLLQRC